MRDIKPGRRYLHERRAGTWSLGAASFRALGASASVLAPNFGNGVSAAGDGEWCGLPFGLRGEI